MSTQHQFLRIKVSTCNKCLWLTIETTVWNSCFTKDYQELEQGYAFKTPTYARQPTHTVQINYRLYAPAFSLQHSRIATTWVRNRPLDEADKIVPFSTSTPKRAPSYFFMFWLTYSNLSLLPWPQAVGNQKLTYISFQDKDAVDVYLPFCRKKVSVTSFHFWKVM